MFPIITRPSSPSQPDSAVLRAALEAVLQDPPLPPPPDMHETLALRGDREKLHPFLDITVNSDQLCLKGTGIESEPTLLSGHVVLQLVEPTSIKEITLHFRGKVKVPPAGNDSYNLSAAGFTFTVCDHDWSFLEGEKKHGHKLKAGRHLFPFHLQIDGSMPCSLSTHAFGGASIQYKLRATASRPGLSHNFQAVIPISIIRSLAPEALEYQQSLEVENTWPGKLMYSLMIPHKAWAAGDSLTAVAKFSPLAKGARVLAVTSTINETVKFHSRMSHQETTRVIITTKHAIIGGRAVCTDEHQHRHRIPLLHFHNHGVPINRTSQSIPSTPQPPLGPQSTSGQSPNTPINSSFPSMTSIPGAHTPDIVSSESVSASEVGPSNLVHGTRLESPPHAREVVTSIQVTIPKNATPTHAVEPMTVSHRIRWNVLIANPDGHTSELRCSLPLHILDHQFLQEARSLTATTRRLLLGGLDAPCGQEEDTQLPSYPSHVRDRVPDVYSNTPDYPRTPSSGLHSPHFALSGNDHLPSVPSVPGAPDLSGNMPLEWVVSELLRQQSGSLDTQQTGTPPDSRHPTRPNSRPGSCLPSRVSSRAPSPERAFPTRDAILPPTPPTNVQETYVHSSSSTAIRTLNNLLHNSVKPLTALSNPFSLSPRTPSYSCLAPHTSANHAHTCSDPNHPRRGRHRGANSSAEMSTLSSSAQPSRLLAEVPDYEVALRGFVGGGIPPLTSLRGLPSYEQASQDDAGAPDLGSAGEVDLTESGAHEEHYPDYPRPS